MVNERNKPEFRRWLSGSVTRLGDKWRKPKTNFNKVIKRKKGKPKMPKVGWGAEASKRGLHPSGYEDVLVRSPSELDSLDAKRQAVRISSSMGGRKREEVLKKAKEKGAKVLNPRAEAK